MASYLSKSKFEGYEAFLCAEEKETFLFNL